MEEIIVRSSSAIGTTLPKTGMAVRKHQIFHGVKYQLLQVAPLLFQALVHCYPDYLRLAQSDALKINVRNSTNYSVHFTNGVGQDRAQIMCINQGRIVDIASSDSNYSC